MASQDQINHCRDVLEPDFALARSLADQKRKDDHELRSHTSSLSSLEDGTKWKPVALIQRLPLLTGNRIYAQKQCVESFGVYVANDLWKVISLAHLNRALQHYGLVSLAWTDMEWFVEHHGKEEMKVDIINQQASADNLFHQWLLATGRSIKDFASDGTRSRPVIADAIRRLPWIQSGSKFLRLVRSDSHWIPSWAGCAKTSFTQPSKNSRQKRLKTMAPVPVVLSPSPSPSPSLSPERRHRSASCSFSES